MTRIKAVIFDLDDTLYDCTGSLMESARLRAAEAMVKAGLPCSKEDAYYLQISLADRYGPRCNVFDRIAEKFSMGEELSAIALEAYNSDEVGDIRPFPDTVQTLETLRNKGYKLFMVTSGLFRRQHKKIELLGLADYFDDILVQDIDRGLTHEECMLDIMSRQGLTPQEIAVVGDRIHSEIRAANYLKMTTIQFMHGRFKSMTPKNELEEADYRVHRLSELIDVLEESNRRRIARHPHIVAVGGGTGLPILLQGLKQYSRNLTAIVNVTDSGRSSGMLRRDLGVLPPGDARNCLIALSNTKESERQLNDLFKYRFNNGNLNGMSCGNILLAALEKITGSFEMALREASKVLAVSGKVIPAALTDTHICAELVDGNIVKEEVNVRGLNKPRIKRVFLDPPEVEVCEEAIEEIESADLIVLGPGSLYTSVITNLLAPEIREAVIRAEARIVYICNIVTQPGQTDGYTVSDHLKALSLHMDGKWPDFAVVNNAAPPDYIMSKYREENADLVQLDEDAYHLPVNLVADDLVEKIDPNAPQRILWEKRDLLRHDPEKLASLLMGILG